MVQQQQQPSFWKKALDAILVYVLWAILIVLALWCLIEARAAVNILYIVLTWNRWVLRAVDRWSLLLMGMLWLAGIIFAEAYLQRGAENGLLFKRFVILAGSILAFGGFLSILSTAIT